MRLDSTLFEDCTLATSLGLLKGKPNQCRVTYYARKSLSYWGSEDGLARGLYHDHERFFSYIPLLGTDNDYLGFPNVVRAARGIKRTFASVFYMWSCSLLHSLAPSILATMSSTSLVNYFRKTKDDLCFP